MTPRSSLTVKSQSPAFLIIIAIAAVMPVASVVAKEATKSADWRAAFLTQVGRHFPVWDADRDGVLSRTELDGLVASSKITGEGAAAVAALKRAVRSTKYQLPPLSEAAIRRIATAPAKDQPDFGGMFRYGADKIARTNRALFASGAPRLETIRQGKLGNCFSLAPLGAMTAGRADAVKAMFRPLPDGACEVVLGARTVRIEPPTDAEIAMTSSNEGDGLWVNLYEKAAGQARNELKPEEERAGSAIDALARGGSAGTMLAFITGHEIVRFSCKFAKDAKTSPAEFAEKLIELRGMLTSAQADGRLMTCGTLKTTTPGLTPNHAYAVLGYDAATDTLRLWNPHGDAFKPKGATGLEHGYPQTDGILNVPVPDFVKQFSGLAFELLPK